MFLYEEIKTNIFVCLLFYCKKATLSRWVTVLDVKIENTYSTANYILFTTKYKSKYTKTSSDSPIHTSIRLSIQPSIHPAIWIGYEMPKMGTKWPGYEIVVTWYGMTKMWVIRNDHILRKDMTWVRNNWKPILRINICRFMYHRQTENIQIRLSPQRGSCLLDVTVLKHIQNIIYTQQGYRLFQTLTDYFVGLVFVIISLHSWLFHISFIWR